jgi:hypothetical protein
MDQKILIILLVIFLTVCIIGVYQAKTLVYSPVDQNKYFVLSKYKNQQSAADLIAKVNKNFMQFLRHLKQKYQIDKTDEESYGSTSLQFTDKYKIVESILKNYNPEAIYENDPINIKNDTSYTVQKGEAIYLCVRSKTNPRELVDYNTLMFVVLHEVGGHIGNYNGWGHDMRFWSVFKFMLREAVNFGIYSPVDYAIAPVDYCGLMINYQPLVDDQVPDL